LENSLNKKKVEGKTGKTLIFIDNDNLFIEQIHINKRVDLTNFFKFLAECRDNKTFIYFYYTPGDIDKANSSFMGFLRFISRKLWRQLEREGIYFKDFPSAKTRGGVDSMIIYDLAEILHREENSIEEIVLVSGDGDFTESLEDAKAKGIQIKIIGGKESISESLKKIADKVLCLEDILEQHKELVRNDED